MRFYWLTLGVLAVWRTTHFLHAEDGPADLSLRLRKLAGFGIWGRVLDCFYCLSVWVSIPFAVWIGNGVKETLCLWPALSAGAILLERLTARAEPVVPRALYFEHGGDEDELLRQKTGDVAR
jgi:hypothetical protein